MKRTNDTESDDDSMRAVSHTNPYTGETAGRLFSRGPTVVADGGRRNGAGDENPAATDPSADDTMKRVDHTPPEGADDANDVFERGNEHGRDDERGATDV
ncbi:hypothetical protein QA600_06170 [Natronococcus sp. A-GB1]|uniref:hypothetical protein n=1 Tax=Natronococcus sp. A-GB1 TaxID=3037648 RepID=UPI00241BE9FF|nr:hypothetical protein [Natronococcus sp. A-GB1]MDG5758924.1 hypothetical protein [Natronococcus sp. A-GB1]